MISSHHHLGVVDQVEGEDEGSSASIDHLEILVVRNEDHHDPEDHESEEDADENSSHHGEVPFGLKNLIVRKKIGNSQNIVNIKRLLMFIPNLQMQPYFLDKILRFGI